MWAGRRQAQPAKATQQRERRVSHRTPRQTATSFGSAPWLMSHMATRPSPSCVSTCRLSVSTAACRIGGSPGVAAAGCSCCDVGRVPAGGGAGRGGAGGRVQQSQLGCRENAGEEEPAVRHSARQQAQAQPMQPRGRPRTVQVERQARARGGRGAGNEVRASDGCHCGAASARRHRQGCRGGRFPRLHRPLVHRGRGCGGPQVALVGAHCEAQHRRLLARQQLADAAGQPRAAGQQVGRCFQRVSRSSRHEELSLSCMKQCAH